MCGIHFCLLASILTWSEDSTSTPIFLHALPSPPPICGLTTPRCTPPLPASGGYVSRAWSFCEFHIPPRQLVQGWGHENKTQTGPMPLNPRTLPGLPGKTSFLPAGTWAAGQYPQGLPEASTGGAAGERATWGSRAERGTGASWASAPAACKAQATHGLPVGHLPAGKSPRLLSSEPSWARRKRLQLRQCSVKQDQELSRKFSAFGHTMTRNSQY